MNILHVITSMGVGGAEKLLVHVANEQIKEHRVTIIFFKIDVLIRELNPKISVIRISLGIHTISKIKYNIKNINPDIIHTHLTHADLLTHLALAFQFKGKANRITTIHSTNFSDNSIINFFYNILYFFIFNFLSRKTKVIAISKSVQKLILNKFLLSLERIVILHNAIPEFPANNLFEKNKTKNNTVNLLFVGRLSKEKAVHILLYAIEKLPITIRQRLKVTIVGDGPLRDSLENLVKKLQIEKNIAFMGNQLDTIPFFEKADIFVLPSIWEGFGIVIIEAFRSKLAVIASDIDGPKEIITDKENGLLFKSENYEELAEKIKWFCQNRSIMETIANKGYDKFSKFYTLEVHVKRLFNIYKFGNTN